MLLGHMSDPSITNVYKILQSGYLKSGKEVGKSHLRGDRDELGKYIYLMFFDKTGIDPLLELDPYLLLDNISYLNTGWNVVPSKNAVKVVGKNITKKQFDKILKDYINQFRDKEGSNKWHEILVVNKIDLVKYLKTVRLNKNDRKLKTYKKVLDMLKIKYPLVKIKYL